MGRQRGKAESWARRAKLGEFVKDPEESLDLSLDIRLYSVLTAVSVSIAFGRSTSPFLTSFMDPSSAQGIQSSLQAPALALVAASVGSCIVCGALFAPPKNRNEALWALKGLLGGPLAILKLRGLDTLLTLEETQSRQDQET